MNDELTILFSGDLCVSGIFRKSLLNQKELFSGELKEILSTADYHVTNLEGPVAKVQDDIHQITNPPETLPYLKENNIGVYSVANNHVFDCGIDGWNETRHEIEQANALYFGAGHNLEKASEPLLLEKDNIRIALVSIGDYSEVTATPSSAGIFHITQWKKLKEVMVKASQIATYTGIIYHGGEEYTFYPSPNKRKLFRRIAAFCKPDFIIGHHSHTVQGKEEVGETKVFYSLGNFIFDYPVHHQYEGTDRGTLISLRFSKDGFSASNYTLDINRKKGVAGILRNEDLISKHSAFDSFSINWQRDAYRVITERREVIHGADKSLKHYRKSQLITSRRFYRRLLTILKHKQLRQMYLAAFFYVIRKKIQRD